MFIVPHKGRFCSFEPFPIASLLSSHDHLVKMWDQRSHKTPLFELTGAIIGHNAEQSDIAQRRPSSNGFLSYFHHATKRWKTKQSLLTIRRESCHHNPKPNTRSTGHSDKVLCCDWSNSEVFWNVLLSREWLWLYPLRLLQAVLLITTWRCSRPQPAKPWKSMNHNASLLWSTVIPDQVCWPKPALALESKFILSETDQ